jgi:hypothetical protein
MEVDRRSGFKFMAYLFIGLGVVIVLCVAAFVGFSYINNHNDSAKVPEEIASQLDFSPFVVMTPKKNNMQVYSYKYDPDTKTLSYIVRLHDSRQLTFNEQASPSNFDEIPELYSKLLDGLNRYADISTSNGRLYLTRPKDGKQVGVLNERGVLLFVRANTQDLSEQQWKSLIERLEIEKFND